jgi:hypothetical protein
MMMFMERMIVRWGVAFVSAVTLLILPAKASADFYYLFDHTWTGTGPVAPAPWVSEFFHDIAPGTVSLTVSNVGLSGTEYVQELYMNLNPNLDPTKLNFTQTADSAGLTLPTIQTGTNSFQADGDGKYDILLSFATANSGRFAANDYITYTISGISGLTSSDFEGFLSAHSGGNGPFLGGAHIVSIGADGASGWDNPSQVTLLNAVPEPSTGLLFGLAAGLLLALRRPCGRQ